MSVDLLDLIYFKNGFEKEGIALMAYKYVYSQSIVAKVNAIGSQRSSIQIL